MRLFEKDIEPRFEKLYEKVVDLEEAKKKGTTAQLLHIILASRTRSEEKAHLFPNRKTEFWSFSLWRRGISKRDTCCGRVRSEMGRSTEELFTPTAAAAAGGRNQNPRKQQRKRLVAHRRGRGGGGKRRGRRGVRQAQRC